MHIPCHSLKHCYLDFCIIAMIRARKWCLSSVLITEESINGAVYSAAPFAPKKMAAANIKKDVMSILIWENIILMLLLFVLYVFDWVLLKRECSESKILMSSETSITELLKAILQAKIMSFKSQSHQCNLHMVGIPQ